MSYELMIIFVFILGTVIGSFLNVCIYRLPKNLSVVRPPSNCPSCKKNILWYDNIPILSYLILGGRCRFCKSRISFRYFLVEALTAVFLLALFIGFGMSAKFFAYSILACGLVVATFVDFEINEIPDQVSLGGLAIGILVSYIFPSIFDRNSGIDGILSAFIGAIAGAASIYLMGFLGELVFKKEAMGGGDVKLMAMIGGIMGWKSVLLTTFTGSFFGSLLGLMPKCFLRCFRL